MNIRAGLILLASLALGGCATTAPDGGGPRSAAQCNDHGVCKVKVSVTKCVIDDPVPEPISISGERDVHIEWELDFWSWMGGNRFVDNDAITVPEGKGEFDQPELSAGGRKLKLHDKNSLPGTNKYKYIIKVTSSVYGVCTPKDPFIVNQG
jgi:hypothetical protein